MLGTKVAAAQGPTVQALEALTSHVYLVRHDICLFIVSFLVSFSIVIMPFEAYLSEALPWTATSLDVPSLANFTIFNDSVLATSMTRYNRNTLPLGATYFADEAHNSYVLRQTVHSTGVRSCTSLLLGLPGVVFYGPSMNGILCAFANSTTPPPLQGTCVVVTFLWIPIAHECLWLRQGNDLYNSTSSPEFTLTFSLTQYPYPTLLWLKFICRVVSTYVVVFFLWSRYYRHYFALAAIIARHGHKVDLDKSDCWRYHLVAGDPTSILVTSPAIVGVFFIDLWLSPHVVATAVLRLLQTQDIATMMRAALYLFRMVWIAYASMCMMSFGLKRFRREHLFAPVDPTVLVLVMTFYGPLLWIVSGNVEVCLRLCQWLLVCLIPAAAHHERIEIVCVGTVYIILVALLPLIYGFALGYIRKPRIPSHAYSSYRYNSLKNRAFITQVHPLRLGEHMGLSFGGSIYSIFEMNPHYKARPTMNSRGSDLFLLCYRNDNLVVKLRLSLLSSIDPTGGFVSPPILDGNVPCDFHVNSLEFTGPQRKLMSIAGRGSVGTHITIHRPRYPNAWCM
ncbi:hypothetical protein ACHHYP_04849 [Achlya hypogyna]|uniref:Transmembrane protein n=1 Tax=Achlya hypogyna TaxID=1202772 RepID=A0A1V9YZK6_ACHHY|nr:hypothetical protein ACHHYP_04849 [Achlya hypogyna]